MNGNGYETYFEEDELEAFAGFEEDLDDFFAEEDDYAERLRIPRRRAARKPTPRTGGKRGYYASRPSTRGVTQAQLKAALAKVQKDVATNATAIKQVNVRINNVSTEQGRQAAALKKEIVERRKEVKKLKESAQMSSLFSLLTTKTLGTTTENATVGGVAIPSGTKLAAAPDATMALLPALMSGSDGDNSMLPLALILATS